MKVVRKQAMCAWGRALGRRCSKPRSLEQQGGQCGWNRMSGESGKMGGQRGDGRYRGHSDHVGLCSCHKDFGFFQVREETMRRF